MHRIEKLLFLETRVSCCFLKRKLYYRILYLSLRIVQSLQFYRSRQITEPRKYCFMCLFFLRRIFFFIFASHKFGNFMNIPLQKGHLSKLIFNFCCTKMKKYKFSQEFKKQVSENSNFLIKVIMGKQKLGPLYRA